jgi:plasmid stabilization system protein ParE
MAFRVEISPRAFQDLDEIAQYIKENSSFEQAEKWFNGIIAAIRTLKEMPNRRPIAEESEEVGQEVASSCTEPATAGTKSTIRFNREHLRQARSAYFM